MINLLPSETKHEVRAARMNVILRNYCFMLLGAATLLGAAFAAGLWVTTNDKASAEADNSKSQAVANEYQATRTAAEAFAKQLTLAKSILASEVSLTQTVTDIAAIIPRGVVLNTLTLGGTSTANTPIDISGRATSNAAIIDLRNSLENSSIFESVSISNITITDSATLSQADPLAQRYPYSITLKAQFSKKATAPAATPEEAGAP